MICKICYCAVLYFTVHFLLFLGQRHFTIIGVCTGGGGTGALAGGDISCLPPEGQRPLHLGRPPVSTVLLIWYDII